MPDEGAGVLGAGEEDEPESDDVPDVEEDAGTVDDEPERLSVR